MENLAQTDHSYVFQDLLLCTRNLLKLFKSPTVCNTARCHTQPGGLMQYQSKVENWDFVYKIKFDVGPCQYFLKLEKSIFSGKENM